MKAAKDTFSTGSSALHTAAQQGDLEEVTSFLATVDDPKSHVQAQDSNGWQPLHEAARGGHTEVAKVRARWPSVWFARSPPLTFSLSLSLSLARSLV